MSVVMRTFVFNDGTFKAENVVDFIMINPKLPARFGSTANVDRPASHHKFWDVPYIETCESDLPEAIEGLLFGVYCLDGGAWDRPTCWGSFYTLTDAVECAKTGPAWRKK